MPNGLLLARIIEFVKKVSGAIPNLYIDVSCTKVHAIIIILDV